MSDYKFILIADPHAGKDGQSLPFNIHGSMGPELVLTALEFGYKCGVQGVFDVGDRIQYRPELGPDDDIQRTMDFYQNTFAHFNGFKFHADGNHDLPNASATQLNAVLNRPAQNHYVDIGDGERIIVLNPYTIKMDNDKKSNGFSFDPKGLDPLLANSGSRRVHLVTHFGLGCSDDIPRSYKLDHQGPAIRQKLNAHFNQAGIAVHVWAGHLHQMLEIISPGVFEHYTPSIGAEYHEAGKPSGAFAIASSGTNGVEIDYFRIRIETSKSGGKLKVSQNPIARIEDTDCIAHPLDHTPL